MKTSTQQLELVPYQHQLDLAATFVHEGRWLGLAEMGVGKTVATYLAIEEIEGMPLADEGKWLVLAPKSVMHSAWVSDAEKFFPGLKVQCLWHHSAAQRKKNIKGDWRVGTMNYESFKTHARELYEAGVRNLVLDESTKIKNSRTQVHKSVAAFAEKMRRVYALTGLVAPNNAAEHIPQVLVVRPQALAVDGRVPGAWEAKARYFFQPQARINGHMVPVGIPSLLPHRAAEFWNRIASCSTTIRKEDCLDLPEKIEVVREVELGEGEKRAYKEMKESAATLVGDTLHSVPTMLAAAMKLRQITSGFFYGDNGTIDIGSSKINELLDILRGELVGKQVVIWSVFTHEIDMIFEALQPTGGAVAIVDGRVPQNRRDVHISKFQSGEIQYLVCHPAAAGHGITLTAASTAVYMSMDFSLEHYEQSRDRIHRIGQKWPCTYIHLIAPGTVDENIYKVLTRKQTASEGGKEALKRSAA